MDNDGTLLSRDLPKNRKSEFADHVLKDGKPEVLHPLPNPSCYRQWNLGANRRTTLPKCGGALVDLARSEKLQPASGGPGFTLTFEKALEQERRADHTARP